ncbi:MAG: amidohydrolase family protein [Terriglobia bacterium]
MPLGNSRETPRRKQGVATMSVAAVSVPGSTQVDNELLISADSHVMEPTDLWMTRLPSALRDQAPRYPERRVGEGLQRHAGGWDGHERVKEMAVDGVSGEVLYTSLGMVQFRLEDARLQEACFRVFNDWLIDYCSASPERLFGIALISLYDVEHGVQELERCRRAGLRGAMIWQSPPDDMPFWSDRYDPFWSAAQDLEMPVSLHILTGHAPYMKTAHLREGIEHVRSSVNLKLVEIMNSLYDLIFYGVLDRFPRMKVVVVENEVGWLPFAAQQWDYYLSKDEGKADVAKLRQPPSAYFGDQIFATFFYDSFGARALPLWGSNVCMWSNDYPHGNSTWPKSREFIAANLGHLPPDLRSNVLSGNVARLYNVQVPSRA